HIQHNHCSLLLDTSGDSLHKRGYRANTTVAPINEVLAAGLIAITQWDGNSAFYDPMCGSGTIAIEAAYKALNLPSQWKRNNFAFMRWKDFDLKHWKEYTQERLQASNLEHNFTIHASDVSEKVIKNSKYNYIAAGVDRFVNVTCADIEDIVVKDSEGILITNPPYEERIITGEINVLYKKIGDVFKNKFAGFKAYLISSNIEATKHIGLKAYMKKDLINGDLPCKFLGYELYQGKKQ
ncbi:MAG: class I SAM-dependent RNA methyltransferase, partial [Saprospiraceae bacterium]|nr:class I SAM-dependent RNA methyltransferase [Saprospiraceae bacterium]